MTARMDEAAIRALPWKGVVPLAQVLRYALPAYGGDTLPESIVTMRAAPSEEEIITTLAAELSGTAEMLFDEPLRLSFAEPGDWTAEDQADFGDRPILPRVGNGMHRVAAAHVAGASHVRVTTESLESTNPPFGDELVAVDYRIHGEPSDGEDLFDFSACWLRSFRLTPDAWVEAALLGSCNGVVNAVYHCPHRLQEALLLELADRTARHRLQLEALRARAVTWEQLEDEDSDEKPAGR